MIIMIIILAFIKEGTPLYRTVLHEALYNNNTTNYWTYNKVNLYLYNNINNVTY